MQNIANVWSMTDPIICTYLYAVTYFLSLLQKSYNKLNYKVELIPAIICIGILCVETLGIMFWECYELFNQFSSV